MLDPPYATSGDLYACRDDAETISSLVREWASENTDGMRVVLCGYDNEHDELLNAKWTVVDGKSGGGSGYSTRSDNGRRERLWLSPACLTAGIQDRLDFGATA